MGNEYDGRMQSMHVCGLYSGGGNGCELTQEVYTCILMVTVHEMNRWYLREALVFRFGITEANTLCDS